MGSLRLHPATYGNQNLLVEKLITEAIDIHSVKMFYIPRKLVAEDKVFGEDRLSEFKNSFPIEVYMENAEGGFEGQQAFASKFGLQMEQSATITIARRRWNQMVGRYQETIIPERPCEGDLLYFPMTNGLFEIMFVNHQQPFYQLGQLYVYKLTIELFRYASERLSTGNDDIDVFESLKSTDVTVNDNPEDIGLGENKTFIEKKSDFVWDTNNPFGDV